PLRAALSPYTTLFRSDAALEILEIDRIPSVRRFHQALFSLEPAVVQVFVEAVIHGRHQENFAAGRRKGSQRRYQAGVDAVAQHEIGRAHVEPIAFLVPVDDGVDVRAWGVEVARVLV